MHNVWPGLGSVAVVLTLLGQGIHATAGKDSTLTARLLPGGGVLDPAGKVGYVPNPGGGIDALDLATGELLWRSEAAPRPLLATEDRLFVQAPVKGRANQVRVLVLDTAQKGKLLRESDLVTFPEWVAIGAAYGRSFRSTACLEQGELYLVWEARAWYAGGAAPPPKVERAARKEASGVARIDLKSGRVEALEGPQVPPKIPVQIPTEPATVKANGRVYTLVDRPGTKPGQPFRRERLLKAEAASGQALWERPIAAPVFLPPLP
jgi:hypothetical protein